MDALEAVRALLPWWVPLAPLVLWAPAACAIGWSTAALARRVAIGPYRRLAADAAWVERARHAQPASAATRLAILLATCAPAAVSYWLGSAPLSLLPPAPLAVVVAACAYAGGLRVAAALAGELGRGRTVASELARDDLVRLLLVALPVLLALALAPALRAPFDLRDLLLAASLLLLFFSVAWGGGLRVLGWLRLTQPAPERLRRACFAAAQGGPEPRLSVVRWSAATAFAFPLAGEIAFTSRCVELLDDEELRVVAAHEIAHLREPLAVRLTRAAMLLALLPLAAVLAVLDRFGPLAALGLLVPVFVAVWLFQRLATRMEQRADHAALCGAESSPLYARALERIYRASLIPAVMPGRQVHPHLYDRLLAAGVTPSWPRPEPPSARRLQTAVAVAALWLALCVTTLASLPILLPAWTPGERASDLWIALAPGAEPLFTRALLEQALGRDERALPFAQAAAALAPRWYAPPALAASLLAQQGRCAEATRALVEAMTRCRCSEDDWLETARAALVGCRMAERFRPISDASR